MCRNRGTSSEVSVASLFPRASAAPASAETARFLPHPIPPNPVSGCRVDTLPGKRSARGSALSALD